MDKLSYIVHSTVRIVKVVLRNLFVLVWVKIAQTPSRARSVTFLIFIDHALNREVQGVVHQVGTKFRAEERAIIASPTMTLLAAFLDFTFT